MQTEKQKLLFAGYGLLGGGVLLLFLSRVLGGTDLMDFLSGLFLGLAVGVMLLGVFFFGRSLVKN
ncbi:hypothetical protein J6B78_03065 [Methanocorpusculum sp.]|nr:hypothetical protein [Methanocorpusculum sp.]MBO5368622.1 hypothetical protein [Methanocorpusculum sp.]